MAACSKQDVTTKVDKPSALSLAGTRNAAEPARVVVAYIQGKSGNVEAVTDAIDFNIVTHVNIAFFDPGPGGKMVANGEPLFADLTAAQIKYVVNKAHTSGRKVLASLVGVKQAEGSTDIRPLFKGANRTGFINGLVELINTYNLDGIDVDVEGDQLAGIRADTTYAPFIAALRARINPMGKLLTVATPGPNSTMIPNSAKDLFDFVNIMSYDIGSGTTNNHSPYEKAVSDIQHYITNGYLPSKLVLGLPAYGHKGTVGSGTRSYKDIIAEFGPPAAFVDSIGDYKYNGIPTIERKTEYALQQIRGVMLWDAGQDARGEFSLIQAIGRKVNSTTR